MHALVLFAAFYTKQLDYHGIAIRAHHVVADAALEVARDRLAMMLDARPELTAALVRAGVELHIIGAHQVTSDLPEHRHLKGKPFDGNLDVDQRTRGLGGQLASCGEENLLHLPGDRYAGSDICVHEFAHAIADLGVTPEVRAQIDAQYHRSIARGLWTSAYAGTNAGEYFAELSMWWFGSHGDGQAIHARPGRAWLVSYDPEGAALLEDLYDGHLVALDPDRATASRTTGARTTIRFHNATADDVHVWWLDARGARHAYQTLASGTSYAQSTYAGHAWLVTDAHDHPLASFVAEPVARVAIVRS